MKKGWLSLCIFLLFAGCGSDQGEQVFQSDCAGCHARSVAGIPGVGDHQEWEKRLEQGLDTLVEKSIRGYEGSAGIMPARGGNPSLTDQQVRDAVIYLIEAK